MKPFTPDPESSCGCEYHNKGLLVRNGEGYSIIRYSFECGYYATQEHCLIDYSYQGLCSDDPKDVIENACIYTLDEARTILGGEKK